MFLGPAAGLSASSDTWSLPFEGADELGAKRLVGGDRIQLAGRAQEHHDLVAERVGEGGLDSGAGLRHRRAIGIEDHVAAGAKGVDVAKPEPRKNRAQLVPADAAIGPEIDPAQERGVAGHVGASSS